MRNYYACIVGCYCTACRRINEWAPLVCAHVVLSAEVAAVSGTSSVRCEVSRVAPFPSGFRSVADRVSGTCLCREVAQIHVLPAFCEKR